MDFERAWLSYRKRTDDLNGRYFAIVYGDFADLVVKTAVREIGRAATEILDVETERKSGTPGPGATGIWLKQEEAFSEEEYRICEKDGLVVISAGGPR